MGDMTKIEALKAKWKDAQEAERQARTEYEAECVADKLREFEAMGGVIGVTKVREMWGKSVYMKSGPFVVKGVKIEWGEARFIVAKLKKDGTASAAGVSTKSSIIILPEDNQ